MKQRIIKKLASRAGESIGETLVALLISALALMMLAGAVSAGMRVVTNSKDKMDVYYKVNNAVVERATEAPTVNGAQVTTFSNDTLYINIPNLLPTGTIPPVHYYRNTEFSNVPVIAYSKPTPVP